MYRDNFNTLIQAIGIESDDTLIKAIEGIWLIEKPVQLAKEKVIELLSEKSGLKSNRISKALTYLPESTSDFKGKVKSILSY
ncbi:hypothetical protein [Crenothrix polyspora]|uniref:Uncharacterized protein n=1 Tax=Crenothrix polyspora TaxID=360316 RepID=A0A1R4HII9_9GAMM|nr:hypothetical protein [Crenothrix polyspora]SJM96054.1 hypothetical protein CRENPOLYSF1_830031 [Crenothrix polyspora]